MTKKLRTWQVWAILLSVLLSGFLLRVALSPGVVNGDAVITQGWMESAVKLGVPASYDRQTGGTMLPTYPPVSLYLFWAAGQAYRLALGGEYTVFQPLHLMFVKLPAILTDILAACTMFFLFARWKRPKEGLLAALVLCLHPVAIYNSTYWGQTDGIFTCAVLLGLTAAITGYRHLCLALCIIASCIKPQAIAFLPLALFMIPFTRRDILKAAAWAVGTVLLVFLPFFMHGNPGSALRVYEVFDLLGETRVSWNAYNMWWMFMGPRALDITGGATLAAGISYRTAGLALFCCSTLGTLWLLRRKVRGDLRKPENAFAVFLAASMSAGAFFLFNAEMHERYYYPFIIFALPLAFVRPRLALIYAAVSLCILFNMLGVFPYGAVDRFLYANIPNLSVLNATLQIVLFCMMIAFVIRYDERIAPFLKARSARRKP